MYWAVTCESAQAEDRSIDFQLRSTLKELKCDNPLSITNFIEKSDEIVYIYFNLTDADNAEYMKCNAEVYTREQEIQDDFDAEERIPLEERFVLSRQWL